MTSFQIIAVAALVETVAWQFLPCLPALLTRKPSVQRHLESVLRIREQASSPEVKEKCNELLQALLR